MAAVDITQAAAFIGTLVWTEGDPVSIALRVDVDWSGAYRAEVRKTHKPTGLLMGELIVAAAYDTLTWPLETLFTLTMTEANSLLIPTGNYFTDIQLTGGVTRMWAKVRVEPQVTVAP